MPSKPAWTEFGQWCPLGGASDGVTDWVRQALVHGAMEGKTEGVRSISLRGGLAKTITRLVADIEGAGGQLVTSYFWEGWKTPHVWLFVWDQAFMNISWEQWDENVSIHLEATDADLFQRLRDLTEPFLVHDRRSKISTICSTKAGLTTREMGVSGSVLVKANYSPAVMKDFHHVIDDLNNRSPCGRISVFDGPPGTGKTYLIRALTEMVQAQFILLPASLVAEISGPGLANVLLDVRRAGKDQPPMVLIVEDADEALLRRDASNVSSVSTLLNIGDGIFGTTLDIRIICTTNAGHLKSNDDLDPAIIRPGRLCRRISVGALDGIVAATRYIDLGGHGEPPWKPSDSVTIAEVYRAVAGDEIRRSEPKKKLGFGS